MLRYIKEISVICALALIFTMLSAVIKDNGVLANDGAAYIKFDNSSALTNNIKDPSDVYDFSGKISQRENRYCLEADDDYCFIFEDSFANKNDDGTTYTFEIDYYDEGNGFFRIYYDCMDYGTGIQGQQRYGNYVDDTVYLTDSKEWKTAKIEVDNAYFGKRIYGRYDFGLWTKDWGAAGHISTGIVPIGEIRVIKHIAEKPIHILSETDVTGHIFDWYAENKVIKNTFTNQTDKTQNCTVTYRAVSADNSKVYFEKSENISFSPREKRTVELDIGSLSRCDIYSLDVDIKCADFTQISKPLVFSVVKSDPNGISDDFMYVASHLANYDSTHSVRRETELIDNICELIKKAGFHGVRSEYSTWDVYEKVKGVYSSGVAGDEIKQAISKYGLRFLQILAYNNKLYMDNADDKTTCLPMTESELGGWREYVKNFVNETSDFTDLYEIWNEPRDPWFDWRTYKQPSAYVKLAEATQEAVSQAEKNVTVTGTAPAQIWDESNAHYKHMMDVIKCGGAYSLDALSVHTYPARIGTRPEEELKNGGEDALNKLKSEYSKLRGTQNVDVWVTEGGISYGNKNFYGNTSKDVGAFNVRFATQLRQKELTKNYCVFIFEETGSLENQKEDTFGMVRYPDWRFSYYGKPLTAKTQYVMLAAYNYLMAKTEPKGDCSPDDNISVQKFFSNKFNKNLVLLNAVRGSEQVVLNTDCGNIELYDEYGNMTELSSNDGSYSLNLTEMPCYILGDFNEFSVSKDDRVSISGKIASGNKDRNISFIVTNADKAFDSTLLLPQNHLYINQFKIKDGGEFNVNLNQKAFPESYKVYVVSDDNTMPICINISKKYKRQKIELNIYDGENIIENIGQYKAASGPLNTKIGFAGTHDEYKFINAFYKDGVLTNIKVGDGAAKEDDYDEIAYSIDAGVECDRIEIYIWNNMNEMRPLCKAKILN